MSIVNRYDIVLIFDVTDGNPNGNPDAGNAPRIDAETGQGLVSDVCIKRKIRNYVLAKMGDDADGFRIYIQEGRPLNDLLEEANKAVSRDGSEREAEDRGKKPPARSKRTAEDAKETRRRGREYMCEHYFDIRAFGAVLSTGVDFGQARGPVQITFARSAEPVFADEHSITRMAVTRAEDAEKQRTMGRKHTIPYGLYRAHVFVSANLAGKTGFSEADMDLLLEALENMFEHDRSAARGEMTTRGLYVFKHESKLGNARARSLFDRVRIARSEDGPARKFSDYEVSVDETDLPAGVELLKRVDG